jgi:hypothetical protein
MMTKITTKLKRIKPLIFLLILLDKCLKFTEQKNNIKLAIGTISFICLHLTPIVRDRRSWWLLDYCITNFDLGRKEIKVRSTALTNQIADFCKVCKYANLQTNKYKKKGFSFKANSRGRRLSKTHTYNPAISLWQSTTILFESCQVFREQKTPF